MSSLKNIKETENRGVHTSDGLLANANSGQLQTELENVINLMGPETPHIQSGNDEEDVSKMDSEKFYAIENKFQQQLKQTYVVETMPNTPRDYSELSSFPTDTVEVYVHPPAQNNRKQHTIHTLPHKTPTHDGDGPCVVHTHEETQRGGPIKKIASFLRFNAVPSTTTSKKDSRCLDLYRINILQPNDDESPPRRVIFDRVEELPKPCAMNAATNTSLIKESRRHQHRFCDSGDIVDQKRKSQNRYSTPHFASDLGGDYPVRPHRSSYPNVKLIDAKPKDNKQRQTYYEKKEIEDIPKTNLSNMSRVDVYYFDHGNASYFHTTDSPPIIMTEVLAEKTETTTTKFWAEIFGTLNIAISFFTSFIVQLFRFFLQGIIRPLVIGVIQMASDYCFKPLLATMYNAVIQPPLIFLYNISTSIRDICDPLAEGLGFFLREIVSIVQAFRIVEVKKDKRKIVCDAEQHDVEKE